MYDPKQTDMFISHLNDASYELLFIFLLLMNHYSSSSSPCRRPPPRSGLLLPLPDLRLPRRAPAWPRCRPRCLAGLPPQRPPSKAAGLGELDWVENSSKEKAQIITQARDSFYQTDTL